MININVVVELLLKMVPFCVLPLEYIDIIVNFTNITRNMNVWVFKTYPFIMVILVNVNAIFIKFKVKSFILVIYFNLQNFINYF